MGLGTSFLSGAATSAAGALSPVLPADLMVERFVLTDAVSEPSSLTLHALLLDANVEL
jgi:uncharacterized protein involved in type VI secretion and phage assembly